MRIAGRAAAGGARVGPGPAGVISGVLVLLAGLIAGYAGQSALTIGAPERLLVSAGMVGSITGRALSQPVRMQLLIDVANTGTEKMRVVGASDSVTTAVRGLEPATLDVPGGSTARLILDAAVQCSGPAELTLPTLKVTEPDDDQRTLALAGVGELTTACSHGTPEALPLTLNSPAVVDAVDDAQSRTCVINAKDGPVRCQQLSVWLASPLGLLPGIRGIRAGGITLLMSQERTSNGQIVVLLTAPATCPAEWLTTGVPTAIDVDLTTGYVVGLHVGTAMGAWLLHASCSPDPGGDRRS